MKKTSPFYLPPTPTIPWAQASIEPMRTAAIALPDILFELGEFKSRHDHDLHELKALVRRREAESGRLADAIQLLRDLQSTLNTPLLSVAAADGNGAASDDPGTSNPARGER